MSHTWWLPQLTEGKLFEGKPEQVKDWNEAFQVRAIGNMEGRIYYIAWKNTTRIVEGTEEFKDYGDARATVAANWKRYLDEEFEREILTPAETNDVE